MLVLLCKTAGFHSGVDDHGSIETQECWFGLVQLMGFTQKGGDHGSIEPQQYWFCPVKGWFSFKGGWSW